jgi:transcriptional regulator with XRE-family HTH domain
MKLKNRADLTVKFGQRLRQFRLAAGLTPSEFEVRSRIDAGNLAKYEQGEREPGLAVIIIMAKGLGIKHTDLLDFPFDYEGEF